MTEAYIVDAVRTPDGPLPRRALRRAPRRPRRARRSRRRSSAPASTPSGSPTSTSAPPTRRARTTATSPGWRRCSPGCRRASRAPPSTGSAPPAWRRSTRPRGRSSLGEGDLYLAGGVESMSRAPWVVAEARARAAARPADDARHDPRLAADQPADGRALLDRVDGRDRRERRRALRDHAARTRTPSPCAATSARSPRAEDGRFAEEIVADRGAATAARPVVVDADEGPARRHLAGEARQAAPGLPRGRHGHRRQRLDPQRRRRLPRCSPPSAGAEELGAEPLARVVSIGVAGVDPAYMGIGPGRRRSRARSTPPASTLDDIDLIEINEAFAVPGPRLRRASSGSTRSGSTSTAARSPSATRSAAPAPAS